MKEKLSYEQLLEENKILKRKLELLSTESSIKSESGKNIPDEMIFGILDGMGLGVIGASPGTTKFTYVNSEMLRLTGYSKKELLDLGIDNFHPPQSLERVKEIFFKLAKGEISKAMEVPVLRKDGKIIYCDVTTAHVIINHEPLMFGFFTNISDLIENNKALFRTKEMYSQLVESSSDGIIICELGEVIFANRLAAEILGNTVAGLLHKPFVSFLNEEGVNKINDLQQKRNEGFIDTFKFETLVESPNGETFPIEIVSGRFNYLSRETELVFIRDNTEKSFFSHKIEESEETSKAILKAFPDILFRLDIHGNFIDFHSNDLKSLYLSPENFIGKSVLEVLPVSLSGIIIQKIKDALFTKELQTLEYNLEINGEVRFYEARFAPISSREEVICIIRDVSERTNLENEIRDKENLFKLITDHTNDVIWIYNLTKNHFTFTSPSITNLRGYTVEEALTQRMDEIFTPQTLEKVNRILPERINDFFSGTNQLVNFVDDFQEYHKNGSIVDTEVSTSFFFDLDQSLNVLGVTRDITNRKRTEKRELFQKEIMEFIVLGKPLIETLNKIIDAIELELPQSMASVMSYYPESHSLKFLCGHKFSDNYKQIVNGLKAGIGIGACGEASVTKKTVIAEDLLSDPNWVEFREAVIQENFGACFSIPILSSTNSVLGTFAVYHPFPFKPSQENLLFIESFVSLASIAIQRYIGETSLRESEDKFSKAFNASPDSFSITTLNEGIFVDVNEVFQQEFLYSKEEVVGKSSLELNIWVNKTDRNYYREELEKQGKIKDFETILCNKNGEHMFYLISSQVVNMTDGTKWILSNSRNITKAKIEQQEKERLIQKEKESSGRIIDILETISDGFISISEDWKITYMNLKAGEFSNRNPHSILGKNIWEEFGLNRDNLFRLASEEAVVVKQVKQLTEYISNFERWLEFKIYPAQEGLNIFFRDITEQKKAEIKLKTSEVRFRNLFESTPDGIIYYDENGVEELFNPSALQILGIPDGPRQIRPQDEIPFIILNENGEEVQYSESSTFKVLRTGIPIYNQVHGLKRKSNNDVLWLKSNVIPFKDEHNKTRVFASFADITQQKLAEEALLKSREELKRANQVAKLGNFKLDLNSLIFTGSDEAYEIVGFNCCEKVPMIEVLKKVYRTDIPLFRQFWKKSLNSEKFNFEHRILVNGKIRWLTIWAEASYSHKDRRGEVIGMLMDITERKNAELQAENEKERLQTLIETIPDLVWVKDPEGKYILCNPQFSKLYQKEPNEMVGLSDYDLLDKAVADKYAAFDELALNSNGPVKSIGEMRRMTEEGDLIVETFKTKLYDTEGNLVGVLGVGRDLTEITGATNALLESERKLKEAQHFAKMGNWELDIRTGKLTWSDEIFKIFEINPQKFDSSYDGFLQLIHPDDRDLVDSFYIESLKSRIPYEVTHRIIMPDGTIKYVQEKCITNFNEHGEPMYSLGTVQDISEIYLAQQALQDREQILSSILDTVGNGIFLINADNRQEYRFLSINKMMSKIIGLNEDEIKGKRFLEILPGTENTALIKEKFDEAIQNKRAVNWEINGYRNGETFTGDVNIVPVFDTNGKSVYIVGAIHDITLRKKAEEELSLLNQMLEQRVMERTEQLESANKELESFAYSVSHDLRAPLRHIDGFAKLLRASLADCLNNEAIKYFNKIDDAGLRMAAMIDSLLKFSRLGRQALQITNVQINKLFEQIIKDAEPDLQNRNIEFKVSEFPSIMADKHLLELAFNNLILNAIKFTSHKNPAMIEIGTFDVGEDHIGIFIKDNGAGFDMTYVDKLFGVFQRLHSQNQYAGTGIGLANVLQIIKKHSGSIWAEGQENMGATFYIKLKRNLA